MSQQLLTASQERTKPQIPPREIRPASTQSFPGALHPVLQAHRMVGNRQVAQLIQARRLTPGGRIIHRQPELADGTHDQYQQEADRPGRALHAAATPILSSMQHVPSMQRQVVSDEEESPEHEESASGDESVSVQRVCSACGGDGREDTSAIARRAKDGLSPTGACNCHGVVQRKADIRDDDEVKIGTKRLDHPLRSSRRIQRREDTGRDGSDYVKLTIPDGTYVLETANIPAQASWLLTYTKFYDVYATASQLIPLARNGLYADPHTLADSRKGGSKYDFKIKPGADLDPQAGWGSAKVQGFRHGYVYDDDVVQAYLTFDTVPMLEEPGKEEFVGQNVIDLNPENHEAFVCPEQGKYSLQRETSVTVTDGVAITKTQSVSNKAGGEGTLNIGKKDNFWSGSVKAGYERTWGRTSATAVTQQVAVSKKLAVNYTCEGPGPFAFVPVCAVWKSPLQMNVSDKTGLKTGQETAYLYRIKYSPNAIVCKLVNGKVDPEQCGQKSASDTATTAAVKSVLDLSPDEFEKDKEAQYKLFTMAKSCRARMQGFADDLLSQQLIRGGDAKSILKRDSLPEFVQGVVDKCRRNGYKRIGTMDDIVRGRFNVNSEDDVNTVAAALRVQKTFPVVSAVAPQRPQAAGGFGYPRWHIIVTDPDTGLTHEWQVGTKAVSEVFEKGGIKLPDGVARVCPNLKNDLHDVEYDIFKGVFKKYPDVHKRHGLPAFHDKVDAVAAEAGKKGDKTPELAKKIKELHKVAGVHFQKLVDEFGVDWIKQFCH